MASGSITAQVVLSSSWTVSGDLHNVLSIRNRTTEELLSEPTPSECMSSPLTLGSHKDEPCYLHIDMTGLRKYCPSSLELVSGSRTVEVYDRQRDEYLSTVRGVLIKMSDDSCNNTKQYSCEVDLLSDNILNNVSIKLLSLKEKECVCISKLLLYVSDNPGGSREESQLRPLSNGHQMLSSLASLNLPPFLQSLVSSLQSASLSRDNSGTDQPMPDLGGMSLALRQIHNTVSPPVVSEPSPNTEESLEKPESKEPNEEILSEDQQQLLIKLEEKLKIYIDEKFVELEQKIESKLKKLFTEKLPPLELNQNTHNSELVEQLD